MRKEKKLPPSLAMKLLSIMTRSDQRNSIVSDFNEIYDELKRDRGQHHANRWYWSQVIKSIPMFIRNQLYWSATMLKNYFKMTLRILRSNKIFSFINLVGLALGIACCILILLWVFDELSYDQFHAHKNNIYRITQEHKYEGHSATTYLPLAKHLVTDFSEVQKYVRFLPAKGLIILDSEDAFKEDNIFYVDSDFFEIFSFPLSKGDKTSTLQEPNSVVITEKISQKYFGNNNPIGRVIKYHNLEYSREPEKLLRVTGVLKNIPHNSHMKFDVLISLSTFSELKGFEQYGWHWPPTYTYVLLSDHASLYRIESQLSEFKNKNLPGKEAEVRDFRFQQLTNIHLQSHLKYELEANGDIVQVYIFLVVATLIIFIACLNYINLSTARAARRAQEVGIKKVLGAKLLHLFLQFIGESFVYVLFAYVVAIGLVLTALPFFNQLLDKDMNLFVSVGQFPPFLLIQVAFLLLITSLAGAYPAFFLSRLQPIQTLKGGKSRISGSNLRKTLVTVQFAISVILISSTVIIFRQMNYIQKRNLGFEKENIVVVPLWGDKIINNIAVLKERLLRNPDVKKCTAYSNVIGANDRIYAYPVQAEGTTDNKQIEMSILIVDYDFIDTFNLEIIEGRKFSETAGTDKEAIIINEAALSLLKWDNPLRKKLDIKYIKQGEDFSGRVIGVVKDFNLRTLHHKIEPLAMFVAEKNDDNYLISFISFKISTANIPSTLGFLKNQWSELESGELLEYSFLDERIENQYQSEQKVKRLISCFTCLAILIACFGLYGLVSFMTEARTKEIGIRRVLGAPVSGIIILLSKEFLKWILLANMAATPLAYFAVKKWLQNFAYRIDFGIWVFIFSLFLTLAIALFTISYQTIKAATANPVDSLRYE
jgi:putative ABC transport system permease protein